MHRSHWEIDSICPKCSKVNHLRIREGELVVRVHCEHCSSGYEYTHVVAEHEVVEDVDA